MGRMPSPAEFPPPVGADEFVAAPSAPEDERIEVGVLVVGGGPAGLAAAIALQRMVDADPALAEQLGETPVALVEKGKDIGAHLLSGAVMRPDAIKRLLPEVPFDEIPNFGEVTKEAVYFMREGGASRLPVPPPMKNHGNWVVSLSQLGRWLGERAEQAGVEVFTETTGHKILVADGAVRGIVTGDKGRGREGEELSNFEPGIEIHARVTILAEGTQGHLTLQTMRHFDLQGEQPQIWSLGVKEIWEVPTPLDRVIHTLGWPMKMFSKRHGEFGGTWLYPMTDPKDPGKHYVSIGLVVGLDSHDATTSAHDLLQQFKQHPMVAKILAGGTRLPKGWGAKTIPEGGVLAWPSRIHVPGALFCGDALGTTNVPSLKGLNYAIHSGLEAAEAIRASFAAGEDPAATTTLQRYDDLVRDSPWYRELWQARNWRQGFTKGMVRGGLSMQLQLASQGRVPGKVIVHSDAASDVETLPRTYPRPDGDRTFDKLSSVYASGNKTRDDQPNHIRVQRDVPRAVAESWVNMCPAQVYEIDEAAPQNGTVTVTVNASNCVQCGAITAKGGRLTPPEGGSGPEYVLT